jgi:hypothetical protein
MAAAADDAVELQRTQSRVFRIPVDPELKERILGPEGENVASIIQQFGLAGLHVTGDDHLQLFGEDSAVVATLGMIVLNFVARGGVAAAVADAVSEGVEPESRITNLLRTARTIGEVSGRLLPEGHDAARMVALVPALRLGQRLQDGMELLPALKPNVVQAGLRGLFNASQLVEAGVKAHVFKGFERGEIESQILEAMGAYAPSLSLDDGSIETASTDAIASANDKKKYAAKVAAGVAVGIAAGAATGGIALAAGASAVLTTGAAGAATGMVAAKKVEEANLLHSQRHDQHFTSLRSSLSLAERHRELLRHARTVPIGSCQESVGEHIVDDRVRMPSLPADVVRQFYFAQLAYECNADLKQRELQRLFNIFGEDLTPSSSDGSSSSTANGANGYVEPWFWHGPHGRQ